MNIINGEGSKKTRTHPTLYNIKYILSIKRIFIAFTSNVFHLFFTMLEKAAPSKIYSAIFAHELTIQMTIGK